MTDVLPRLSGIVKVIVASEAEIPVCCQACRFSDQDCFREWFCAVSGKEIEDPRDKPDWCPIEAVNELETNKRMNE
jgi:hypothetical protein